MRANGFPILVRETRPASSISPCQKTKLPTSNNPYKTTKTYNYSQFLYEKLRRLLQS